MLGQPPKPLKVDLSELRIALKTESSELKWYVDVTNGEVLLVNHEYEPNEHGGLTLEEIEAAPLRYLRVPQATADDLLSDMWAFKAEVNDPRLAESIDLALGGLRPERRFKALLGWLPGLIEAWQTFRERRVEDRALSWLASRGYAPKR